MNDQKNHILNQESCIISWLKYLRVTRIERIKRLM